MIHTKYSSKFTCDGMCYSRDQRYDMMCSAVSEYYDCNLFDRFSDGKFDTDIAHNAFYEPEASIKEFLKFGRSLKLCIIRWCFKSILLC